MTEELPQLNEVGVNIRTFLTCNDGQQHKNTIVGPHFCWIRRSVVFRWCVFLEMLILDVVSAWFYIGLNNGSSCQDRWSTCRDMLHTHAPTTHSRAHGTLFAKWQVITTVKIAALIGSTNNCRMKSSVTVTSRSKAVEAQGEFRSIRVSGIITLTFIFTLCTLISCRWHTKASLMS